MKTALIGVQLRLGLYGNLAWAAALVLYTASIVWVYPSVSKVKGLGDYLTSMPEQLRQLAGIADFTRAFDEHGFYTFNGFLTSEYLSWLPVLLGVYAIISGAGLVAKEAERGTLEVLLSQPIQRHGLLLTRVAMQIAVIAGLVAVSFVSITLGAALLNEQTDTLNLFYAHAVAFGLIVTLFSFAVLCSTLFLHTTKAMAIAGLVTVALYALNVLAPSLGGGDWLQKASPFTYYDVLTTLNSGHIGMSAALVYSGASVIALAAAVWVFERRDLAV